jgi:NAD(P)-dependent dehydrogenase (short-subunit alcohol dehydrogenase family)
VKAIGPNATVVQGDVAKMADLDLLYETVGKVKGRVDIIFANAGVGEFVRFGEVSEEHFDKLVNINVMSAFFAVQKALPLLNDGGSIILAGSIAGSGSVSHCPIASMKGTSSLGVCGASKAAVRSFVPTWTSGVRIEPG